ncbi:thimet oligopeptidase-like isoform X1 [Stegodyphus dumicola]|uniref:thimet oligopeptidase-like isoform X1 n=1 Tax=Stegodyphus dumicola TaxID=202533 RepID=UPI0015AB6226|nr:thimet oligopeptidase-like isoform X1 [Stegodyphus dumicola]
MSFRFSLHFAFSRSLFFKQICKTSLSRLHTVRCNKRLAPVLYPHNSYCGYLYYSIHCKSYRNINNKSTTNYIMSPLAGSVMNWDMKINPNDLIKQADEVISNCRKKYDAVGAVPDSEVSYKSVLKVLDDIDREYMNTLFALSFPQSVSTDKLVRDASTEADRKLQAFGVEVSMRPDIFNKLLILEQKQEPLETEAKRYLKRLIILGKRNGLHLSDKVQEEVKSIKNKVNELAIQFNKNLVENSTILEFTDEELDGLPSDFISDLEKNPDTGKRKITLKYPHFFPVMRKCKNPETRRQMEFAFNTQCLDENSHILGELITLRKKHSDLLGYSNHASFIAELRMSKTAENIYKFLKELQHKLTPLWNEERKSMLELKEKECSDLDISFDGKLNPWDLLYYSTKVVETKYNVDKEKLKEYFPLSVVTKGLLEIYQELLGLKFKEIKNAEVWAEDVQLFSVADAHNGTLLGYFFLDLFPREGKYTHAALFELQPGCRNADGSRQIPIGAMVANFSKPLADKPSLLDHEEVETYFHEFGHTMHHVCARANFAKFSGTNVERDFVEAPSQMLENWCWEIEPLKRMSSHYADKSEIPKDLINALLKSRLANTGYRNLRQIVLAMFDHKIYTNPEADIAKLYSDLSEEIVGIKPTEGTNFATHFAHTVSEYDAQYYGYLWSEVYSADMFFSRFGSGNLFNPEVGLDYRKKILQPGASKDAIDMVVDFLGRQPTQDAFLRSKGLQI